MLPQRALFPLEKMITVHYNTIILLTVSNRKLFGPHHTAADEAPENTGPYTLKLPGS